MHRFRDAIRAGRSDFRIVVPTATLERHLRNQLAREGLVFRPELVATLSHFTGDLSGDLPEAPEAALHLIVEDAVRRARRPEFTSVAGMAGFHEALARTLRDLDTAGCDPDTLERKLHHAPLGPALLAIWRETSREMARRGFATRSQRLRTAATAVARSGVPGVAAVSIDGFLTFSDPELEFIDALRQHAEVTIEPPAPASTSRVTEVLVADNIEREADEIARRILVANASGMPFREMGIVARDRPAYEPVLRATLERFGIPARFYFDSALDEHPVTRFIAGLVEAKLSGWDHERAAAALRLAPRTGVSAAMDRFDIAIREQLPNGGIDRLLQMAEPDRFLSQLIANCRDNLRGGIDARGLFHPGRIPDGIAWETAAIYRGQAAALQAIEEAVEQASQWHELKVSFAELWRTVKTILRLTPLRPDDRRRNVVHVLSAYEARQWDLPAIFICGLVEGQFPKRNAQNLFLPDSAVRDLQAGGIRLRTSADLDEEETLLFEAISARASASLVLTYPRADAHGEAYVPSTFLGAARHVAVERRVRPAPRLVPEKWKPASVITHPELLQVLNTRHASVSATGLESFLQCPFQFFATKTLRLREFPRRPEERLDFLTMGSIVHRFLAEWFVERPPVEPLFDRIFREACAEKRVPPGYRTEMLRHRMREDLQRFCEEDAWPRGAIVETEKEFTFTLEGGVAVRGRIDRLETLPDGSAIVIDYKYSPAQKAKKLIEDETRLQAPIYLMAVERAFELRPAAMVYYSLRDEATPFGRGNVPGLALPPLSREWLSDAEGKIIASAQELRGGRIHPAPATLVPCRYCDARDVCRHEIAATLTASASGDEAA